MPADAPAIKVEATRGYGAEVRFYDRLKDDREALAAEISKARGGMTIVPAFNDPHIIAGQGTVGLELARQAAALGAAFDLVIAPVGGGGLISGVSEAVKSLSPATAVWGVEPSLYDDARQSLAAGHRITIAPDRRTLCDALETPCVGDLTFPMMQKNLAGITAVNDAEVADAMRYAFTTLKLVVEPGGSVGLAALLCGRIPAKGRTIGLVLSGGNVDPELYSKVSKGEV